MATGTKKAKSDTGTDNCNYDLTSVLYHALESAATCEQYIEDAKSAGDDELVEFFQQVKSQTREQAEQAKSLMKNRL